MIEAFALAVSSSLPALVRGLHRRAPPSWPWIVSAPLLYALVALAGGGSPRLIYARLATLDFAGRIDWSKVHVFFGDERCVPPDDSRSNYRMAREALLDHVPLPPGNIHRIRGEDDPALAALAYEQDVQRLFRSSSALSLIHI